MDIISSGVRTRRYDVQSSLRRAMEGEQTCVANNSMARKLLTCLCEACNCGGVAPITLSSNIQALRSKHLGNNYVSLWKAVKN